jgi:hypothetical protein
MTPGRAPRYTDDVTASHLAEQTPGHYVDSAGRGRVVRVEEGWQAVMPWGQRLPFEDTVEAAHEALVEAYRQHQREAR